MPRGFHKLLISFCPLDWVQSGRVGKIFFFFLLTMKAIIVTAGAEATIANIHKKASHHSRRQPEQSLDCLALAPHVSFSHSRKSSSSFFRTRNCPSTTYALSKPLSANFFPRTSPIPARVPTGFSPMGSATKSRCFWEVDDILAGA